MGGISDSTSWLKLSINCTVDIVKVPKIAEGHSNATSSPDAILQTLRSNGSGSSSSNGSALGSSGDKQL
jgi:hypothetical protein